MSILCYCFFKITFDFAEIIRLLRSKLVCEKTREKNSKVDIAS